MSVAIAVRRQVAVTEDDGAGVFVVELCEQRAQALALRLGARVGRLAGGIQTTLVAHAYRMLVVPLAVGARLAHRAARMHGAVARDVVVVADVLHTAADMVLAAPLYPITLPGPRGRAMKDDETNRSHLHAAACGDGGDEGGEDRHDNVKDSLQCFLRCFFHET